VKNTNAEVRKIINNNDGSFGDIVEVNIVYLLGFVFDNSCPSGLNLKILEHEMLKININI